MYDRWHEHLYIVYGLHSLHCPDYVQVIEQHGGSVVDSPDQCSHILALHKQSEMFAKVRKLL